MATLCSFRICRLEDGSIRSEHLLVLCTKSYAARKLVSLWETRGDTNQSYSRRRAGMRASALSGLSSLAASGLTSRSIQLRLRDRSHGWDMRRSCSALCGLSESTRIWVAGRLICVLREWRISRSVGGVQRIRFRALPSARARSRGPIFTMRPWRSHGRSFPD